MTRLFQKGLKNQTIAQNLKSAIAEGDCSEIGVLVQLGGAERMPVDTYVNATPRVMRPPSSILRIPLDSNPEYGSEEMRKELQQVIDLSEMRDVPLEELPLNLPMGLRVVSKYLQDVKVPKYAPGVDYGTDEESFLNIQSGAKIPAPMSNETTTIKTGRDAAAYVHHDSPMSPWVDMVKDLLRQGIPPKMPDSLNSDYYPGQSNFTVFGFPFMLGMLGQAVQQSGYTSFHTKWDLMYPRPEEAAVDLGMGFLSQAYPEGSPMHPSRNAMHSFAAQVQKHVVLKLFDGMYITNTGQSVEYEANLLCDNIGMWRFPAGVHYLSDHKCGESRAEALAAHICQAYFR